MKCLRAMLIAACVVLSSAAGSGIARAQHLDVLVQQTNGQLVTGTGDFDHDVWTLGPRVFHRDFDGDFAINNPGFNSIGAGSPDMPAGAQALPAAMALSWDFLPMTINDGSRSLFYWNGQDIDGVPGLTPSDVVFGPLPGPNYTLSLFDQSNTKISASGANAVMPGGVIDTTAADGFIHRHRFWFLEDGDGNSGTPPADGIYLLALRLRIPGLSNSLPVFMIFGTPGSSIAAEDDAAVPWVQQQLNLPGDYNQNGVVDAADYTLWRDTNGQNGLGLAADGDGNQHVEPADYVFWRQHFGQAAQLIVNAGPGSSSAAGLGATAGLPSSASVPEPTFAATFLTAAITLATIRRRTNALNSQFPTETFS